MGGIERADGVLPRCQDLLRLAQALLGARHQCGVGELLDHQPVFLLGALGVGWIAVRLLHLHVVDVGDLHLRFGGFGLIGEEGDEVLVLGLRLLQRCCAAFLVPGIADGQLGAHLVLRFGIGVQQGLQIQAGHVELALLERGHGLVEQLLIRLLGGDAGQRIGGRRFGRLLGVAMEDPLGGGAGYECGCQACSSGEG